MGVSSIIRGQLARRAPALEEKMTRANWRLRNRDRAFSPEGVDRALSPLLSGLVRQGVVIGTFDELIGDSGLFERAAAEADRLYAEPRAPKEASAGGKASYLTKLATGSHPVDSPFVEVALHPNVLAVANGYLRLRSTLRSLDLWLTEPTPGPAIETQLWHRDADDVLNVKLFVYFTDVTRPAGPLCYAPGTHPLGPRRELPERDAHNRSTDEQVARIVPESEWIFCEGARGTVVMADTCGYHKQVKPEGAERLLLVAHYVSGTPYVPRAVELQGIEPDRLSNDQYVAAFDRVRA